MTSATVASVRRGIVPAIKGWATVARIPFLTVGIMPYLLGAQVALSDGARYQAPVFWLGLIGVVLIMLATYFNGEYADVTEDRLSTDAGRNPFAGGSGGVIDGLVDARHARVAGNVASAIAIVIGLVLAFVFHTGVWTIPLGVFGLITGYFYSARPFRWVQRGIGELFIGISYGWLPIAVGHYLLAGTLPVLLVWLSIPVGITIFNVIYMNEFPDYQSDVAVGKRNLLARVGQEKGIWIYVAAAVLGAISFYYALTLTTHPLWVWFAIVTAVSAIPTAMMLAGTWRERAMLVPMCGLTIVANLTTTAVLIAGFWGRG